MPDQENVAPVTEETAAPRKSLNDMQKRYVLSINEASAMCFVLSKVEIDDSPLAVESKLLNATKLYLKDLRSYIKMSTPKMMEGLKAVLEKREEDVEDSSTVPEPDNSPQDLPQE
ncbi:MAG TPA: hypothetical protein PL124_09635 [Candidatus Cloacimonadota bacterium]|nr:hypothetical protein [Candidatus Cloacimonadota bacterium]HPS39660.1 hypothetical protein [Candidatus Cloacimonadota bacterium]